MQKDHGHDLLFRHTPFEQQGNRLGYGPPVFAQQPFPQQSEMFVSPLVPGISELYPDFILTYLNGERLQVIAFIVKTSSCLQIEAAAVPVAGKDAVAERPAGPGRAPVGALV